MDTSEGQGISYQGDVAHYIDGLSRELRRLASDAGLGMVAYLLDMVAQEAGRHAQPRAVAEDDPKPEIQTLAS